MHRTSISDTVESWMSTEYQIFFRREECLRCRNRMPIQISKRSWNSPIVVILRWCARQKKIIQESSGKSKDLKIKFWHKNAAPRFLQNLHKDLLFPADRAFVRYFGKQEEITKRKMRSANLDVQVTYRNFHVIFIRAAQAKPLRYTPHTRMLACITLRLHPRDARSCIPVPVVKIFLLDYKWQEALHDRTLFTDWMSIFRSVPIYIRIA